jgi:Icc-related predicted phosphoesterase
MNFFFVSDLHGNMERYQKLFTAIEVEKPAAVFFGGDLTESGLASLAKKSSDDQHFFKDFLMQEFSSLKRKLKGAYPGVFFILGNDDIKTDEEELQIGEELALWHYVNQKKIAYKGYDIYGYAYVPPTPFLLKDFEKYDVSQYVDPGCVAPEDGMFSTDVNRALLKRDTIKRDLEKMEGAFDPEKTIMLFHSPPYQSSLDRAALDGKFFEHVPLDVHIGSIAIKEFIIKNQPKISLHGHVHESARITGKWKEPIGKTIAMSAAHDGNELSLVVFNPEEPEKATRSLL